MKSSTQRPMIAGSLILVGVLGLFLVAVLAVRGNASASQPPRTITIKAKDVHLDLDTITVSVGQPVTIRLENDDEMNHAFDIDALNVRSDVIKPHQVTSITFTPTQVGTFEFRCPLPGHAQLGMVGTFQVVP